MGRRALSMVTEPLAREGVIFQPLLTELCLRCDLFSVCIGATRPLASYRVVSVRSHYNFCPALREKLRVVVVEEMPVKLAIEAPFIAPGAEIKYRKPACSGAPGCDAISVEEGERVRILRELQRIGDNLWLVEAEPLDPPSPRLWLIAKQKLLRAR